MSSGLPCQVACFIISLPHMGTYSNMVIIFCSSVQLGTDRGLRYDSTSGERESRIDASIEIINGL